MRNIILTALAAAAIHATSAQAWTVTDAPRLHVSVEPCDIDMLNKAVANKQIIIPGSVEVLVDGVSGVGRVPIKLKTLMISDKRWPENGGVLPKGTRLNGTQCGWPEGFEFK